MVLSPCIAILGAEYITILYPAFQVPSGYVYFGIVVWMVVSSWDNFKKIKLKEWLVFAASMLFMASIVIVYLKDRSTYVTEIMNTIYPGSRVSTGVYSLYKMFEYVATIFYPFKATLNNSEFSMMVTLFPLPMVMAVYCIIKQKGKDILLHAWIVMCIYNILYSWLPIDCCQAHIIQLCTGRKSSRPVRTFTGYITYKMYICMQGKQI